MRCNVCGGQPDARLTVVPRAILAGAKVRSGGRPVHWCRKCWDANIQRDNDQRARIAAWSEEMKVLCEKGDVEGATRHAARYPA